MFVPHFLDGSQPVDVLFGQQSQNVATEIGKRYIQPLWDTFNICYVAR